MTSSVPNPGFKRTPGVKQPSPEAFHEIVDGALRERAIGTRNSPAEGDPDSRALLRYAAGRAKGDERTAVEAFVARSSWAEERVVALVRAGRPDSPGVARSLARRLLDPALDRDSEKSKQKDSKTDPIATLVATAVLESEGHTAGKLDETLRRLEKSGNAVSRAACLVGLGKHDEARKLLKGARSPAVELLRKVSSAKRPGGSLDAVLDAFPALLAT